MPTVEGTMTTQSENTLYVWRRNTERQPSRWVWWVIGGLGLLCGFGAFAAFMAEDPGQISTFAGLWVFVSGLVWSIPRVYGWGRRRNPDIVMDGRAMVWAKKRVPIDQVDRWSARRQTTSMYNGTVSSSMTIGVVRFKMADGSKDVTFTFPHLTEAELADVIAAIEPVLPGRQINEQ